jgi:hypothetical protein
MQFFTVLNGFLHTPKSPLDRGDLKSKQPEHPVRLRLPLLCEMGIERQTRRNKKNRTLKYAVTI